MSFSSSLKHLADLTATSVNETTRAVAIAIFTEIIERTPFLTGRLASNWQCSLDSPKVGTVGIAGKLRWNDKGRGALMVGINRSAKSTAIKAAVDTLKNVEGDFRAFLANNLPYARRIEFDGWSHTKAPAGMVGVTFARVHSLVQNKIRELASKKLQEGFLK